VSGRPSCHLTFSCRRKVQVLPSGDDSQDRASHGFTSPVTSGKPRLSKWKVVMSFPGPRTAANGVGYPPLWVLAARRMVTRSASASPPPPPPADWPVSELQAASPMAVMQTSNGIQRVFDVIACASVLVRSRAPPGSCLPAGPR
jgi:hypothetical protein